jgi:hypothetical protein
VTLAERHCDPNRRDALIGRGRAFYFKGDKEKVISDTQAIRINAYDSFVLCPLRAVAYQRLGHKNDKANVHFAEEGRLEAVGF